MSERKEFQTQTRMFVRPRSTETGHDDMKILEKLGNEWWNTAIN